MMTDVTNLRYKLEQENPEKYKAEIKLLYDPAIHMRRDMLPLILDIHDCLDETKKTLEKEPNSEKDKRKQKELHRLLEKATDELPDVIQDNTFVLSHGTF
eukprot:3924284-Rhodomonas_salina.1